MPDDILDPASEAPAAPTHAPLKAAKRAKPKPGRHGSGQASARVPAPTVADAPTPAPRPASSCPTRAPHAATAPVPEAEHGPTATFQPFQDDALDVAYPAVIPAARPPAKRCPKPKPPAKVRGHLSLEDTIAVSTALVVMLGPFTIVHIETTGPDPDHDEITAIHALRVDKGMPIAEFSALDQPLQEAVTGLLEFLGNNRQYVFAHGAAVTQAFLGRAARRHGMLIENPAGDAVDLARLAWPDRSDYSLSGLAAYLGLSPERIDAAKAILEVLKAAAKQLTAKGGRLSSSIGHWGRSTTCGQIRQEPW